MSPIYIIAPASLQARSFSPALISPRRRRLCQRRLRPHCCPQSEPRLRGATPSSSPRRARLHHAAPRRGWSGRTEIRAPRPLLRPSLRRWPSGWPTSPLRCGELRRRSSLGLRCAVTPPSRCATWPAPPRLRDMAGSPTAAASHAMAGSSWPWTTPNVPKDEQVQNTAKLKDSKQ